MPTIKTERMTQKAVCILCCVLLVYGGLVATHEGEFWPFSIYPMFSQPGSGWTRSLVREFDSVPDRKWESLSADELPGTIFPLNQIGLNQNDLSDLVSGRGPGTESGRETIRNFFRDDREKNLAVYLAVGRLDEKKGEVLVEYLPKIYLIRDSIHVNPEYTASGRSASGPIPSGGLPARAGRAAK